MALFGFNRRPRPDEAERRRLAALVREVAGLGAEVAVTVNEIVCPDPACPGLETVILVMPPGQRTQAYKIPKPVAEATRADVATAFAAPA